MNYENNRHPEDAWQCACGKVILFGEHAVVYGARAIAGGIPDAVRARAVKADRDSRVLIAGWGVDLSIDEDTGLIGQTMGLIRSRLRLDREVFHLEIESDIPHASGLGASAALAVASIRALSALYQRDLKDADVNALAYECEKLAHGTPSGLDNTLATYGGLMCLRRAEDGTVDCEQLACAVPLPLLVMISGKKGYTAATVAKVRAAREKRRAHYDGIFAKIDEISDKAAAAFGCGDFSTIGQLMDQNQQLLRDIDVSCDALEALIRAAKDAGAEAAKLTGSGEGGAAIAYCGDQMVRVRRALQRQGWPLMQVRVGN